MTASLGAKTGSKQFTKSVSLSGSISLSYLHYKPAQCALPLFIVSCNSKEKLYTTVVGMRVCGCGAGGGGGGRDGDPDAGSCQGRGRAPQCGSLD